jgi:hypothetical protein
MYRSFQAPRLDELFFSAWHDVVLGVGVGVGGFVFYFYAYILMRNFYISSITKRLFFI